jgi:hypothetical protein
VAASASTEPHPSARPPADGDGDPPPPPPPPRGAHATTSRRPRRRRGGAARTRGRTDGWHQHREQCVRAWWWGKPRPNRNRLSFPRATPARERPPITCPPAQASLSAPGWGRVPPPHHTTPGGWDGWHDGDSRDPRGSSHRTRRARGRRRSFPGRKLPRACRSEKKPGAAARAARQRQSPAGCVRAWSDGDGRAPLGGNQSKVFVSTWSPCSFLLVYHRVLCLSLAFACFSPFFFPSSYQVICFPPVLY